jgi:hypothetical protein
MEGLVHVPGGQNPGLRPVSLVPAMWDMQEEHMCALLAEWPGGHWQREEGEPKAELVGHPPGPWSQPFLTLILVRLGIELCAC